MEDRERKIALSGREKGEILGIVAKGLANWVKLILVRDFFSIKCTFLIDF